MSSAEMRVNAHAAPAGPERALIELVPDRRELERIARRSGSPRRCGTTGARSASSRKPLTDLGRRVGFPDAEAPVFVVIFTMTVSVVPSRTRSSAASRSGTRSGESPPPALDRRHGVGPVKYPDGAGARWVFTSLMALSSEHALVHLAIPLGGGRSTTAGTS